MNIRGVLIIIALLCGLHRAMAQQVEGDVMNAKEEQELREAGKNLPPEQLERLIREIKERRREAASYRANSENMKRELVPLIEKMRAGVAASDEKRFAEARDRLGSRLYWYSTNNVPIPPKLGNELSDAIMEIYEKRGARPDAPDDLPIMVAAKYGSSRRAKNYIKALLHGPFGTERDQALESLARTENLKGDSEIFSALMKELDRKEGNADIGVMGVMSRVDSGKALPIVLYEVKTTQDIKRFTRISDTVSRYGRTDLIEHVLKRIDDFPKRPWADAENPTIGIYDDLLLRYIAETEDEKLELGLKALNQAVGALLKCPQVILEKLEKGAPRSRRAVGNFLKDTPGIAPFKKPEIARTLEERKNSESDEQTKRALEAALKRIRKDTRGRGDE